MKITVYLLTAMLFGVPGALLVPRIVNLFRTNRAFLVTNYEGKEVVVCGFIIFAGSFLSYSAAIIFAYMVNWDLGIFLTLPLAAMIFGTAVGTIAGIIDDLVITPEKGFKGHIQALIKGNMNSGILKILLIGMASFMFSFTISGTIIEIIVSAVLISLTANFINLLDLRPGRALKIHLLFLFATLFLGSFTLEYERILPVFFYWFTWLVPLLIFLIMDLRKRVILGDGGSNSIGFLLGASWAYMIENLYLKVFLLTIILLVNIYAEFGSITILVERNDFLRKLDNWGRSEQ